MSDSNVFMLKISIVVFALLALHQLAAADMLPGISINGSKLTVAEGRYTGSAGEITVTKTATFDIAPAEIVEVKNQPLKLSPQEPGSWGRGTKLPSMRASEVNANGALIPESLVIKVNPDVKPLVLGKDYLLSPEYGMVGIGPDSAVDTDTTVYASFRISLMRIDSIQVDGKGVPSLVVGESDIATPMVPAIDDGSVRLLNVLCPRHTTELAQEDLFPILENESQAVTKTTTGRIPKTLAKLKNGEPVTIVCLGDSVTAGGEASAPEYRYVNVFDRMIHAKYPDHKGITVKNVSYGGSNLRQWLRIEPYTDEYFDKNPHLPKDQINFQRVIDAKPDLVTLEFVNDAGYPPDFIRMMYGDLLDRLLSLDAELILITPHYTCMPMMSFSTVRQTESRPYVHTLYEFADDKGVAIADASSRWAHLWKEGIPYYTLLKNTINHPIDHGHRIFAEEMMKCFE